MKQLILGVFLISLCSLYGCAAGAATAGYALKASSADELSLAGRQSIVNEVKEWANSTFIKK